MESRQEKTQINDIAWNHALYLLFYGNPMVDSVAIVTLKTYKYINDPNIVCTYE
jgi:hypothetical protein